MDNSNRKRYEALANFRLYKFVLWILFSFCIGIFLFYVLDRCDVFPPHANRTIVPDEILTRTDAYELFDKQFSHLLTTFGIILSVFGIALPVISYFFQRVSLRDEREAIQHEIDISLKNIKEKENELEQKILQAENERIKQFSEVESHLLETIENAKNNFYEKQNSLDNKIKEFEKEYTKNNGFLFLQFAISNVRDYKLFCIYSSMALQNYSVYAESEKHCADKCILILKHLKKHIAKCYKDKSFNSGFIKKNISVSQKNVRADSVYWRDMQDIIDKIDTLDRSIEEQTKAGEILAKISSDTNP